MGGYSEPKKIAETLEGSIIKMRVSVSNPICRKYGVVSGYGVTGEYRLKGFRKKSWNP